MDWYPWYFLLYEADTMHLNPYQDGCYRRLIDHYMKTRQALPDNEAALARIVGDSEANWVAMASAIVRPFFKAKNGRLYLMKCEELLFAQDNKSKGLSESGRNGAKKRWNKVKHLNSHPIATPLGSDSIGQDKREEEDKKEKFNTDSLLPDEPVFQEMDLDSEFETFWLLYPKKRAGSKDKAKSAYLKALTRTKTTPKEIYDGVERYRNSDEATRENGRYAKGCAAWLNDDRWTNQYEQGGQRDNPKASYLDKLQAAGRKASEQLDRRMEADRDAPWNRDDNFRPPAQQPALTSRNHSEVAGTENADTHETGNQQNLDDDDGWRN